MPPLAFAMSPLPQGFVDFDLQRAGQTVKNAALAGFDFGRDVYPRREAYGAAFDIQRIAGGREDGVVTDGGGSLKSMPDLSRVMVYAVKTPFFERSWFSRYCYYCALRSSKLRRAFSLPCAAAFSSHSRAFFRSFFTPLPRAYRPPRLFCASASPWAAAFS